MLFSGLFLSTQTVDAQSLDRRTGQTMPQQSTMNPDLPRSQGTFYFADQIGLTLGISGIPSTDVIDAAEYILGPGDLLTVNLSGNINGVYRGLIINQQGDIVIPNVGSVQLNGVLLKDATAKVSPVIASKFRDTNVVVTLERPRMIKIHVAGDVPYPGSYYIPAQTRLDKAVLRSLFQPIVTIDHESGETIRTIPNLGRSFLISGRFSTRNIRIQRGDQELIADLVSYGVGGIIDGNPVIQHDDIIFIYEKQRFTASVSVSGAVKSPLLLDYRPDDSVHALLQLAGGLSNDANTDDIRIFRQQSGRIESFQVRENDMMTPLQPNDRIVVGFDREARSNQTAWVFGEAVSPGNFPISQGETTVLELLNLAGGLTEDALARGAYLIRSEPDGLFFDGEPNDLSRGRLNMLSASPMLSETFRIPSDASAMMRRNPAFNADMLKRSSDQFMEGFEYLTLEAFLNKNQVFIDLRNESQIASTRVFGGDQLYIPRDDNNIFILGQVKNPGYYAYSSGWSANDYIRNAGGLGIAADSDRVFVIKAGNYTWFRPQDTVIESGDILFIDRKPFDTLLASRQFEFQQRELRNRNIQLVFAGLATVASIITAYVAVTRN